MIRRASVAASAASLFLLLLAAPAIGVVHIQDGEFPDALWEHELFVNYPDGNGIVTAGHSASGGNPGACMVGTADFYIGVVYHGHFHADAAFNPSVSGALLDVTFSMDAATLSGGGGCGSNPSDPDHEQTLVAHQDTTYYYGLNAGATPHVSSGWVHIGPITLGESDFVRIREDGYVDYEDHPDFSTSGGLIRFGFFNAGRTGSSTCTRTWAADNFDLTLEFEPTGVAQQQEELSWGMVKAIYRPLRVGAVTSN
jgi:hypothetical protein